MFDGYKDEASHRTEKLKCSASETLGLYSILRHYVETQVPEMEELALQRRSFFLMCRLIDLILDAKRGVAPMVSSARALREAMSAFMTAHVQAYGRDHIKPKHHWLFDICDQLERHFAVYDAFIIERLHLRVKAVANLIDNLRMFEVRAGCSNLHRTNNRYLHVSVCTYMYCSLLAAATYKFADACKESVLAGIFSAQSRSLRRPFAIGLVDPVGELDGNIQAADAVLCWHGLRIAVGACAKAITRCSCFREAIR